jgi:hypothetical protein
MILQKDKSHENEKDGKKKMNVGKSNQNGVERITNIFGHDSGLFDNDDGKNEIDN